MQKESQNSYYVPAEDSIFIANYLENQKGKSALDIGTGSGILAKVLSKNFELVVATDIDIFALKKAHEIVDNCICCNSADALNASFDLVVCNLPYLPSEKLLDRTVDGLQEGIEIPGMIIKSAIQRIGKGGRLVFLTSSHANYNFLIELCTSLGFDTKIVTKKKLFYEELLLVECMRKM